MDIPVLQHVDAAHVMPRTAEHHEDFVAAAFEAHQHELYSFLVRATRSTVEAEDLLQETFIRLTREAQAGRVPAHLRGWLYRVAGNLVVSRGRRQSTALRWFRSQSGERGPGAVESPEAGMIDREHREALERALRVVGHEARVGLLMSAAGFSGREIAKALGRTENSTRTMLCRARIRVREELGREADR